MAGDKAYIMRVSGCSQCVKYSCLVHRKNNACTHERLKECGLTTLETTG